MKIVDYKNIVSCERLHCLIVDEYNKIVLPHLNVKRKVQLYKYSNIRNIVSFIAKNIDLKDMMDYIINNSYDKEKGTTVDFDDLLSNFSLNGQRYYHGIKASLIVKKDDPKELFTHYVKDDELEAFLRQYGYGLPDSSPMSNAKDSNDDDFDLEDFAEKEETKTEEPKEEPKKEDFKKDDSEKEESKVNLKDIDKEEIKKMVEEIAKKGLEGYRIVLNDDAKKLLNGALEAKTEEIIDEVSKRLAQIKGCEKVIVINSEEKKLKNELYHESFNNVLQLVANKFNVYLYSEAGVGKSHLAKQIANALDLPFYTMLPGNSFDLLGYEDAMGKFHETPFTLWVKNGGVLYASEFDSNDSTLILNLNLALANGWTTINGHDVKLHETCRFIADGNTKLNGATYNYAGRQKQDSATIDRFVFVEMDFDYKLENALAQGNEEWISFIRLFRELKNSKNLKVSASMRATIDVLKMETIGCPLKLAINMGLLKGMNGETVKSVSQEMIVKIPENKYAKALVEASEC